MGRILGIAFLFFTLSSFSQKVVSWTNSVQKDQITFTATIQDGWHLYSQNLEIEFGPIPTSFNFEENPDIELIGTTIEPKPYKEFDSNFDEELTFFKHEVSYTQKFRSKKGTTVNGHVTYMVCNATMCLPPTDEYFEIEIK